MTLRRLVAPLALTLVACTGATVTPTTVAPGPTGPTTPPATTTTTTLPDLVPGGWAMMTPDGLIHHEEGPIEGPGSVGWHTVARDRTGGIAYLSDGSLWWLPVGEAQAREVAPAEGDLVEVIPTADGPVARIGFCDSTYISLEDGIEVEEPSGTMVDASCVDDEHVWNAANGLQARIAGPGVLFDSEGQVAGIEDVAALQIVRDGEVIRDIPVGGFYEAYARIHDFDGRHVIVSRGPFEPAMPEETYYVLDLDTGDTGHPGVYESASATLLGPDAERVPALRESDYVHRGKPLFTDDSLTRLDDGRYVGYVTGTFLGDRNDLPELRLDLAVWFEGKEADYAALEDGEEAPRPDGHYIRNDDSLELSLRVAPGVEVTSVWYHHREGRDPLPQPITWEQFVAAMTGEPSGNEVAMLADPWWVTLVDGEVVAIEEQYIP